MSDKSTSLWQSSSEEEREGEERPRNAEEREQRLAQVLERIASDCRYYEHLLVDEEDQLLSTLLRRQTAELMAYQCASNEKI